MSKLVSVAEQQLKTAISNSVLKAVSSNTLPTALRLCYRSPC